MKTKEQQFQSRLLTCKHFNGIMNRACEVGIDYDTVKDKGAHPFRWACLSEGANMPCLLREYPTREELETEDREIETAFANVMIVRKAIVEVTGGKRSVSGVIDCPACKAGHVHFSVAFNGHVHAQCTTSGCVNWLE